MTDRIKLNDDGTIDEIVAGGAHLENLDKGHWFLAMTRADGSEVAVWLWSKSKITATYEVREPVAARPDTADLIRRLEEMADMEELYALFEQSEGGALFPGEAHEERAALLREAVKALEGE